MIEILVDSYSYENKIPVIKNVHFTLQKGKISALIGASGCGKSTFLRVLMGMEKGAIGKIIFENNELPLQKWDARQKIFSMVPQIPHLFPWKNILENITIAISKEKEEKEQKPREEIALEVLKIVQMDAHIKKYPDEISLGMAQRVSFARALVLDTKAILLDEPFASLDAHTRYILQRWLANKITETNKYAILVTHDVREALLLSNEIHVLSGFPAEIKKTFPENNMNINEHPIKEREIINLIGDHLI